MMVARGLRGCGRGAGGCALHADDDQCEREQKLQHASFKINTRRSPGLFRRSPVFGGFGARESIMLDCK
jgi:hypothetical protein